MEHYVTGISTHCALSDKAAIHWITSVCACGQVFTETSPSVTYRAAATSLSRKAILHISEENRHGLAPDVRRPPRVSDA